jgi:hypothetical protein
MFDLVDGGDCVGVEVSGERGLPGLRAAATMPAAADSDR